ncbi:uncharacterized protein B0T23DRAFT_388040 [Neurospora hispaniola]|uniref:Uncharacterized protein n=1 Tax=Neurospora hispaniola TaxID=588809 RepID=A0AAJ0MMR3_9PEZI|nr:hypothetical protein B0T23DRAFT_388040 [Neurospora hispaniola]
MMRKKASKNKVYLMILCGLSLTLVVIFFGFCARLGNDERRDRERERGGRGCWRMVMFMNELVTLMVSVSLVNQSVTKGCIRIWRYIYSRNLFS